MTSKEKLINVLVDAKICNDAEAKKWGPSLKHAADQYQIDTPKRLAGWLAQCAHESNCFNDVVEQLNYSRSDLLSIFSKHFDESNVDQYVGNPEKIANRAYANRMGNGDENSGDGWKYRGRGIIQLTGKDNYAEFGMALDNQDEILANPDLVAEPKLACISAAWFWCVNDINEFADKEDLEQMTMLVNGSTHAIKHIRMFYDALRSAFGI